MKVIITEDYLSMSREAAKIVLAVVKKNPRAVLGLATGDSPIGMYEEMIRDHEQNGTSYEFISSVNLDEYVGLPASHVQSYAYFMRKHLFDRVNIDLNNTALPDGVAKDKQAECDRYNALLATKRQSVQVLGIGSNGHIGFNEPGTPFDSVTHVVDLTPNTIKDNSRLFASVDEVPTQAYSMGISNILNAEKIVIVASGEKKAWAVRQMIEGEISPAVPATALRGHKDVTVVIDAAAASLLRRE